MISFDLKLHYETVKSLNVQQTSNQGQIQDFLRGGLNIEVISGAGTPQKLQGILLI